MPTSGRITINDLARGFNQLHACFEAHKRENTAKLQGIGDDVGQIARALGVRDGRRVAALNTPWQSGIRMFLATTSAIVAVAVALRIASVLGHPTLEALKALYSAIMAGKI